MSLMATSTGHPDSPPPSPFGSTRDYRRKGLAGLCEFVRIKSSQACASARSCPSSVRRRRASWQQHSTSTSLRGWRWQHREGSSPFFRTTFRFSSVRRDTLSGLANPNYASSYYTYLWSRSIAKDLFTQFDSANLMDPSAARRYRELVLEPGGSRPVSELVERFLGRPWSLKAYEGWLAKGVVYPN